MFGRQKQGAKVKGWIKTKENSVKEGGAGVESGQVNPEKAEGICRWWWKGPQGTLT